MERFDVIVIGAGVVGSAVARELARYRLNSCVLEKELDVACGNSSRNTGMLHAATLTMAFTICSKTWEKAVGTMVPCPWKYPRNTPR